MLSRFTEIFQFILMHGLYLLGIVFFMLFVRRAEFFGDTAKKFIKENSITNFFDLFLFPIRLVIGLFFLVLFLISGFFAILFRNLITNFALSIGLILFYIFFLNPIIFHLDVNPFMGIFFGRNVHTYEPAEQLIWQNLSRSCIIGLLILVTSIIRGFSIMYFNDKEDYFLNPIFVGGHYFSYCFNYFICAMIGTYFSLKFNLYFVAQYIIPGVYGLVYVAELIKGVIIDKYELLSFEFDVSMD